MQVLEQTATYDNGKEVVAGFVPMLNILADRLFVYLASRNEVCRSQTLRVASSLT